MTLWLAIVVGWLAMGCFVIGYGLGWMQARGGAE